MRPSPDKMSPLHTFWAALWMCLLSVVISSCPCEDPSLCKPISISPKKEIFAFSISNAADTWNKYNWSLITTVARAGAINSDLMCLAHKHGARIVLLVDYEPITDITNSTKRQIWVKKIIQEVQLNYYDGVNFDVEAQIKPDQKALRDGYTALVKETVSALRRYNPWAQVSIDVGHTPNAYDRYYDLIAMAESCDFLVIMDYDEWGGLLAWANSPYHFALEGILGYMKLQNVSGSKLVMAGPWYGYDYACRMILPDNICVTSTLGDGQPEDVAWMSRMERPDRVRNDNPKQLDYSLIMTLLSRSTTGRIWDDSAQSPYFNYMNPADHQTHQIWYDDPESLAVKFELVNYLGLRGAGMWNADLIDYSNTTQARMQRSAMWGAFSVIKP